MLKKTDDYQPDDESVKPGDESLGESGSKGTDEVEEDDDETDPVRIAVILAYCLKN